MQSNWGSVSNAVIDHILFFIPSRYRNPFSGFCMQGILQFKVKSTVSQHSVTSCPMPAEQWMQCRHLCVRILIVAFEVSKIAITAQIVLQGAQCQIKLSVGCLRCMAYPMWWQNGSIRTRTKKPAHQNSPSPWWVSCSLWNSQVGKRSQLLRSNCTINRNKLQSQECLHKIIDWILYPFTYERHKRGTNPSSSLNIANGNIARGNTLQPRMFTPGTIECLLIVSVNT